MCLIPRRVNVQVDSKTRKAGMFNSTSKSIMPLLLSLLFLSAFWLDGVTCYGICFVHCEDVSLSRPLLIGLLKELTDK